MPPITAKVLDLIDSLFIGPIEEDDTTSVPPGTISDAPTGDESYLTEQKNTYKAILGRSAAASDDTELKQYIIILTDIVKGAHVIEYGRLINEVDPKSRAISICRIETESAERFGPVFNELTNLMYQPSRNANQLLALLLAAIIRRSDDPRLIAAVLPGHGSATQQVLAALSLFDAHVAAKSARNDTIERVESVQAAFEELDAALEDMGAKAAETEAYLTKQRSLVADLGAKTNAIAETTKNLDAEVETTRAALMEEVRLSETRSLWKTRAREAQTAYRWSAGLLVVILIGIPFVIWLNATPILQFVQLVETAGTAGAVPDDPFIASAALIGRLALLAIPVALIVWLVRLIVRFNTRSMLLMDDARQRTTVLDTYLFLVEQGAADKGDRAALLEALFRRVPGHGADTVEPPDFVDLLKLNQSGKTPRTGSG